MFQGTITMIQLNHSGNPVRMVWQKRNKHGKMGEMSRGEKEKLELGSRMMGGQFVYILIDLAESMGIRFFHKEERNK